MTAEALKGHLDGLLLAALEDQPQHGYAVIETLRDRSSGTFDLPTMFAALVILALLGVILFWIVDRIERLVIPWHVSQREELLFAA